MPTGPYCPGCPQQPYGQGLVTFSGTSTSGIMCIGESPWYDEIAAGTPFAGAAGSVFDRLLQRVGLDRRDVVVTNSAWCKAPRLGFYDSKDPNAAIAMAQCRPYLDALIDRMKPKVLVPMGNVALRRVCGVSGIESYAGYVLDTVYGVPAVPTFHPSYIMQGKQKLSPVVIYALDRAREIAQHGFHRETPRLLLDPTVTVLREYVDSRLRDTGRIPSLFVDLETPESANLDEEEVDEKGASWQIIRASFSIEEGIAVSFPWTVPFISILQELLDASNETVEWATNHFDSRRLAAAGLRLPDRNVSALWAWHWLQSDLRKGLEYVAPFFGACTPWKHKNVSDPAYYSAVDSLEGRRCYQGTMAALKAHGRWDSFDRHCIQADPILQQMGRTGILIDPAERESFMGVLRSEHDAAFNELQTVVPDSVKPRKYWKRPPKDMTAVATLCGTAEVDVQNRAAVAGGYTYMRVEPFLPRSWPQVQKLAEVLKVKLPKKREAEDENDVSTERKYLLAPARKHRAFRLVLDCRERGILLSTYQWPLDERGRAVTTYGWHPSTLRKCVAKGTMIEIVRDVSKEPYGVPVERVQPGDLAYTYDANGNLTLRKVLWAGKTGNRPVIRLHWMAQGSKSIYGFLDVTPDHLLRLVDGTYKQAKDLKIAYGRRKRTVRGDRILSLHRGNFLEEYSRLSGEGLPNGANSILDHRFVWETTTRTTAEHVHHRNGNGMDNRPENLQGLTVSEHLTLTGLRRWRKNRRGIINHKIVAVEAIGAPVDVYDIEVEETHNFIANELCVHNSSRSVNLQNIPKRSRLAKKFRRMIVAAPGHLLVESDFSAIEAVLAGYFAGSEQYIKLAKSGVHGWLTQAMHGTYLSPDDVNLKQLCGQAKEEWPDDYDRAKRIVHASNFKTTPIKIAEEYPEEFPTVAAARKLQNFYFDTPAGQDIRRWQDQICIQAAHDCYLENPFKYRHWFYEVSHYDKRREKFVPGDDAKRAIAFLPQSTASAIQTEALLRLTESTDMLSWLRLIIHDSFLAEPPESEALRCAQLLALRMRWPIPELGGLQIGVEVTMGRNWAPFDSATNPDGMRKVDLSVLGVD